MNYRINPQVLVQHVLDETILIHLETERVYTLNLTASELWRLLEAGEVKEQIQADLSARFAVDPQVLSDEITALLAQFVQEDLIVANQHDH